MTDKFKELLDATGREFHGWFDIKKVLPPVKIWVVARVPYFGTVPIMALENFYSGEFRILQKHTNGAAITLPLSAIKAWYYFPTVPGEFDFTDEEDEEWGIKIFGDDL